MNEDIRIGQDTYWKPLAENVDPEIHKELLRVVKTDDNTGREENRCFGSDEVHQEAETEVGRMCSTLLKEAVEMFYAQDAEMLLREEGGRSACERCIVNCIARYLWFLIQQRGLAADVDVEYNLDCKSEDPKRIRLEACRFCSHAECLMHAFVNGRIRCKECLKVMRGDPLIYPDLIVHVRGSRRNHLAVEFKKEDEARKRTGNYKNAAKWDMAKLQYLSCKERMDGVVPYEDAVFVILKSNEADFILPEQFPVAEGIGKASTDEGERGGMDGYFRP